MSNNSLLFIVGLILTISTIGYVSLYSSQKKEIYNSTMEEDCSSIMGETIEIGTFHYEMVEKTMTDWIDGAQRYNPDHTEVKGSTILTDKARLPMSDSSSQKVYFPKTEQEAALIVKCANKLGKKISVRGGGHEYNGASLQGDIVVATRDLALESGDDLQIVNDTTLVVNTNYRLGNLYKHLYQKNPKFNIVAGSCPTVVIGGFTLAGGHGTMTSYYGLAAHYLKEVRVITPEGEIQDINDETDPEYMKNLRGAGHSLGIALQFTFDYSSIPQDTWNFALYEGNINVDQLVETLQQFEQATRNNQYQFASLAHFGGGAVGQSGVRIFAFAPSHQMTLQQLKESTEKTFTHLHLVPGSDLEDRPYYEVITYDIPAIGQISVEYGWQKLVQGSQYWNDLIYNSYIATGIASDGLAQKIQAQFEMGWMPWSGTTNYRYKQTGPYAQKSMYHPYPNSQETEDIFLIQITGGDMNQNQFPETAYKTVNHKYPNYPPNFGKLTEETFYNDQASEVRDFRKKIDPQGKFSNKFDEL